MDRPEHQPWKGPRYDSATVRLLLLGKAHYGVNGDEDTELLTEQLVRRVREGVTHEPFFTKTADLVARLLPTPASSDAQFWDSVAFANYIPVTVGQGVHDVPTEDMWCRAQVRLFEIVEALRPTHVLSLGKEQWNAIRFPSGWTSTLVRETPRGAIRLWRSARHSIVATPVDHPTSSYGFQLEHWREHVRGFLDPALNAVTV